MLRIWCVASSCVAALALIGAAAAVKTVTFDTMTVHRINVVDREGKLAMVIASHDDEGTPVIHGYAAKRAQGNNADNGIIFYNQKGDEQGGLIWSSSPDRSESGDTLSFDTANTDQLIQVRDGDEHGHHIANIVGWDRVADEEAQVAPMLEAYDAAKTPAEKADAAKAFAKIRAPQRFLLGYGPDDTAILSLADGKGRPRIRLSVTKSGVARMQFLDASGKVVDEIPRAK